MNKYVNIRNNRYVVVRRDEIGEGWTIGGVGAIWDLKSFTWGGSSLIAVGSSRSLGVMFMTWVSISITTDDTVRICQAHSHCHSFYNLCVYVEVVCDVCVEV